MAFKSLEQADENIPESPEKILRDLPRRKIPDVLHHQGEIMKSYTSQGVNEPDVALQLPTGSGKTLVGLLIAEWRRRKFSEKVVYLCPTIQLVNQVVEQANDQYGLTVNGFTGSISKYNPTKKAEYNNAIHVAVTTYSALFNTNPFFNDPDTIIVDDAHSSENYIASLWTLQIEREKGEHKALHHNICQVLKPKLNATNFARLNGQGNSLYDITWVDKLPGPELFELREELSSVLDTHTIDTDLIHSWSMIKDHLDACQLYMSTSDILIRPLIPPTWTHLPFQNAKQRIFMSATLGQGGDLERLTGRKKIQRLPIPEGWERQGIGRRFFMFPEMSLKEEECKELRHNLMMKAGRSVMLVPSDKIGSKIESEIKKKLSFKTFNAYQIEKSKKEFIESEKAVVVVANRYDGIDFPGNHSRLLLVNGLPKATNSQEKFLMSRMGANLLFNDRIQTRVLQAIGRCTRSMEDYSAVVVTGSELPDYLSNIKRRVYLHPELQSELNFGINESMGTDSNNFIENFEIFLENGSRWEEVNKEIIKGRSNATQKSFPAMQELQDVVIDEINCQMSLWDSDYAEALHFAEKVIGKLVSKELKGYRALWYYLAGNSALFNAISTPNEAYYKKAREHYAYSKKATKSIPWLVNLSKYQLKSEIVNNEDKSVISNQIEKIEDTFARLGTLHDRKYTSKEKEILTGLESNTTFENAHKELGELLGFDSYKFESDASPDPYWIKDNLCLVFEDHAGANQDSILSSTKARQVSCHPDWIKSNTDLDDNATIISILISPVDNVSEGGVAYLEKFSYWELGDFKEWASNVLSVLRGLRKTFVEPGDLAWRSEAISVLEKNQFDMLSLINKFQNEPASKYLSHNRQSNE